MTRVAERVGYEVLLTADCGCCTIMVDADLDDVMSAIDRSERDGDDAVRLTIRGVSYGGIAPGRSFHLRTFPRLGQEAGLPVPEMVEDWIRRWRKGR